MPAGGRTLALFTSWGAMTRAAQAVRAEVDCPILVQGEGGKGALVSAFSEQPAACLFATMGFWQGVDVPGPTLSLVVIDRIPFPRPDEPLTAARRDGLPDVPLSAEDQRRRAAPYSRARRGLQLWPGSLNPERTNEPGSVNPATTAPASRERQQTR